ncbi:hypothetical protein Y032_0219g2441 [Ancylostoma ceylanicum]|uniref:Uncharacterized protein n=1 Tax=Ancylostoma ceylanicum TaxID=53326 RepID=A0A016SJH2_9BILA|nr:hypothetical protein Y032_0219g2441 [Ancylostoma ceylanicum]
MHVTPSTSRTKTTALGEDSNEPLLKGTSEGHREYSQKAGEQPGPIVFSPIFILAMGKANVSCRVYI